MMASPTYTGSHLFLSVSELVGIPLDQFNFVVAQLTGLLLGFGLRLFLPHTLHRPTWRLVYCLLAGLYLLWFMIGWATWLVLVQVFVSYALMKYFPQNHMQLAVFCFALVYMLTLYVLRLLENFEDLCYDPTYPLMITTQKLTSLAFSVSDWKLLHRQGKHMDQERQRWAVRQVPSLLEFCAFVLSFQGVLAGPFCHYNIYRAFIEGNTKERLQESQGTVVYRDDLGSCLVAVRNKLLAVTFWIIITAYVKPHFPDSRNVDEDFIANNTMLTRIGYLYISLLFHRAKYYVTWILADAIYNASGMGYAGRDKSGKHLWTDMSNVFVLKIETATSPKVYMDNWNILTTHWLRYVCYTRAPFLNTLLTFMLSAAWHGLFIGYYVTFVSAAFTVQAARRFRANVRPLFQSSAMSRFIYDVFTFLATQLSIAFLVLSFVILKWEPTIRFHSSFYWSFHVIVAAMLLVLPSKRSSTAHHKQQENHPIQLENNLKQQENNLKQQENNLKQQENHLKQQENHLKQQENHHQKFSDQQNHHRTDDPSEKWRNQEQQQEHMDGRETDVCAIGEDGDGRLRKREVMFVQKS